MKLYIIIFRKNIRKIVLAFITITFFILLISISSTQAVQNQEDNSKTNLRLEVEVMDIDQKSKLVLIRVNVFVDNYPYNASRVEVEINNGDSIIIFCNKAYGKPNSWFFQGKSDQIQWLMTGTGEVFPFDVYNLNVKIDDVENLDGNFSLSSESTNAFFKGVKTDVLKDIWFLDKEYLQIADISNNQATFIIRRNNNTQLVSFVQFLLPIIVCYYLLGSSLILHPEEKLRERLTIFLSLFAFASTYIMAIQQFLPYRTFMSLSEFLLINLMVSVAIFGIVSIIINRSELRKREKMWREDYVSIILSLILFLVIYRLTFSPKVNLLTSFIITILIIPSYLYGGIFRPGKRRRNFWLFLLYLTLVELPYLIFLFYVNL